MKFLKAFLMILLACPLFAIEEPVRDADPENESDRNLNHLWDGVYIYRFSGFFGPGLATSFGEIGEVIADGCGHLEAHGTSDIGGTTTLHPSYSCNYHIGRDHLGSITCTRYDESGTTTGIQYNLAIDRRGDHLYFLILPGNPAPFTIVQIQGEAQK